MGIGHYAFIGALTDRESENTRNGLEKIYTSSRGLRIALIDDEAPYREGVVKQLQAIAPKNLKLEVSHFDHPSKIDSRAKFDLMLVDIDLNDTDLNGFDVIKTYRTYDESAVITVHSNRIDDSFLSKAVEAGANHTIPKPASMDVLGKILKELAGSVSQVQIDSVTP